MAGDIEEYIERLKEAAEENRELFIGSIRMLAAAQMICRLSLIRTARRWK